MGFSMQGNDEYVLERQTKAILAFHKLYDIVMRDFLTDPLRLSSTFPNYLDVMVALQIVSLVHFGSSLIMFFSLAYHFLVTPEFQVLCQSWNCSN